MREIAKIDADRIVAKYSATHFFKRAVWLIKKIQPAFDRTHKSKE